MIEQVAGGRAHFAYESVVRLYQGKKEKDIEEYRSYIKKLPMMIKVNGFAQALAFYFSKGDKHKEIQEVIDEWFGKAQHLPFTLSAPLKEGVLTLDADSYRFATLEAIDLLNWMRRFADGLYQERKSGA